jgi:ADP-ribose pyrophosphatase
MIPESELMTDTEVIFQAKRFRVERVHQVASDGSKYVREIVRHPGAVVILPLLDDGQVVFIRNYRAAVNETLIELPAGTLDRSEAPLYTAKRELAEETGYRAGNMELLLTFCMSPGILDEKMHLFLATALTPGRMALEQGEDIQPFSCTWDESLAMVRRGDIRDAKTLVGLLYYERFMR